MANNINQDLADDYAGIASSAAQVSAEATALSLKHEFIASKDATVDAYHKAKDKLKDATANTKEKMADAAATTKEKMATATAKTKEKMSTAAAGAKEKMAEAKDETGEFFHKVGGKIKGATASVLEKTADAADNLAAKMR